MPAAGETIAECRELRVLAQALDGCSAPGIRDAYNAVKQAGTAATGDALQAI